MPPRTPKLPTERPSRVIVEPVRPMVDGGNFPTKAALGEPMVVDADVFADGHDVVAAALRWRQVSRAGKPRAVAGDADARRRQRPVHGDAHTE